MKHVIIGTAGHVDHGKTSLIRALTGTDTDRLREEQERGMTIDLGFAQLTLPDGTQAGIVDVPGHERFLKNMLAGAGGVDVVLLVIAADESVMPQTVEHLDILRLLDVKNGVVALTKCDMVEPDWIGVVEEDIHSRLEGSFLASAPIVRVDSIRGVGIPELKRALLAAVSRAEARNSALPFRLPIDRVFTRQGFGTVVTGTLVSGTLRVGDSAEILPAGTSTRIRGLQSHGKKQATVEAGCRVAVNLAGIEREDLDRGATLAPPGVMKSGAQFDAAVTLLASAPKPLKHRARVRVHIGAAELIGRVQLLGLDEIEPGGSGFVQFRCEHDLACARGDRFVMRSYSPMRTIGGGAVLDPDPPKHKRRDAAVIAALTARQHGSPQDLVSTWLRAAPLGRVRKECARDLGLSDEDAAAAIELLQSQGDAIAIDKERILDKAALQVVGERVRDALSAYHSAHPLRPGMPKEDLRGSLGRNTEPRTYSSLVHHLQRGGIITTDGATVRLEGFKVALTPKQQAMFDRVMHVFETAGYASPSLEEVVETLRVPLEAVESMVHVAVDRGTLVRIAEGLFYPASVVDQAKRVVREQVEREGCITVSQFRDLTSTSRKYAVPTLEYFDNIRFTKRVGDARVLVEAPAEPS